MLVYKCDRCGAIFEKISKWDYAYCIAENKPMGTTICLCQNCTNEAEKMLVKFMSEKQIERSVDKLIL